MSWIEHVKINGETLFINGYLSVSICKNNRHYNDFVEWVKAGNLPEGADVIEPNYVALRTGPDGYAPLAEQMDMQFKNDGSWEAHVQAVKDKYPKTITGGTTIAPLPQWVLDLVEETNV